MGSRKPLPLRPTEVKNYQSDMTVRRFDCGLANFQQRPIERLNCICWCAAYASREWQWTFETPLCLYSSHSKPSHSCLLLQYHDTARQSRESMSVPCIETSPKATKSADCSKIPSLILPMYYRLLPIQAKTLSPFPFLAPYFFNTTIPHVSFEKVWQFHAARQA